ncbi:MAG: helix-turn-helix domain-containing protein, partial [Micromonosporaceae bacterium]|nr:helix-turn-helix domain-containing protein [Micromonosporaceae bacterium]
MRKNLCELRRLRSDRERGVKVRKGVGKTVQARQLGRHLREVRKEAGLSVDQAAAELGLSTPTMYRFETGLSVPRSPDLKALCAAYGVDGELTDALIALAKEANTPGWWHSFNGGVPRWFDTYVALESSAEHIRAYDAELVVGLLQTRAYAEATHRIVVPEPSDSERDQRVSARMQRQKLLARRKAPRVEVILGEAALRRRVGEPAVMTEQLRSLDAASRLPHVTIRVLPIDRPHCALIAGARFNILTFPGGRISEPPLAYTESLCGALYLDKPVEYQVYDAVWQA